MSNDSGEGLKEPHVWKSVLPEEVFAGLREWASTQPFTVSHVHRLAGGRSGAYVAVVRIIPDHGLMRQAVLKVVPPDIAGVETRGVQLARQYTPAAFWQAHMVPTSDRSYLPRSGWCVHLQDTASADLTELHPLAELLHAPDFAERCGAIVDAIVTGWHQLSDEAPQVSLTRVFLHEFLDRQKTGLDGFAQAAGIRRDEPANAVGFDGRVEALPNPFGLLAGLPTDALAGVRDEPAELYVANGHGDLQLFNVLVPRTRALDAPAFRLIDYGRFSPRTPVSRDPVKLMLSIVGAWLSEPEFAPGTNQRARLADAVVSPRTSVTGPVAAQAAVLRTIHDAARQWGLRRNMVAEWQRQHLLVLIGSALRTVADIDLSSEDRWWYFEVAALATEAYVREPTTGADSPPKIASAAHARQPGPEPRQTPVTVRESDSGAWSTDTKVRLRRFLSPNARMVIVAASAAGLLATAGVVVNGLTTADTRDSSPPATASPDGVLGPDPRWAVGTTAGAASITSPAPEGKVNRCLRLTGTMQGLADDETLIIAKRRESMFAGQPFDYFLVNHWDKPSTLRKWTADVVLGPASDQRWNLIVLIAGLADIRRENTKPSPETTATFRRAAGVVVLQTRSQQSC